MHVVCAGDTALLLLCADKNRLILLCWENGGQIANFYGAVNEDLSQPRHCWHPSGLYIYGVSLSYFFLLLYVFLNLSVGYCDQHVQRQVQMP